MDDKKHNDEALSRRDFFRKIKSKVIPILGTVILTSPFVASISKAKTPSGCYMGTCMYSCYTGCVMSCGGTCMNGCLQSCVNQCAMMCGNSCQGGCMDTCAYGCSSCVGECKVGCGNGCASTCVANCATYSENRTY